ASAPGRRTPGRKWARRVKASDGKTPDRFAWTDEICGNRSSGPPLLPQEEIADFHAAVVPEVGPEGLGHGPELLRVGEIGTDQLGQPVYGICGLRQLVARVEFQVPAFAAADGVDENHRQR